MSAKEKPKYQSCTCRSAKGCKKCDHKGAYYIYPNGNKRSMTGRLIEIDVML